jgi:hypothetical protein
MKIIIPFPTPSVNHLYARRGFRSFLTKEAKELKEKIHNLVPNNKESKSWTKDSKFIVIAEVYENWFTQKGDIARKDVANREKFVTDSIFDKLKVDDKQIFDYTLRKIQELNVGKYKTVVTIVELKYPKKKVFYHTFLVKESKK